MTTFTLNIAKWRCGDYSPNPENKLGEGDTSLLNDDGYMCCLGQFLQQIGIKPSKLLDVPDPVELPPKLIKKDKKEIIVFKDKDLSSGFANTDLTNKCMDINDDYDTSVKNKVKSLKKVLKENGHKLKVVNEKLLDR